MKILFILAPLVVAALSYVMYKSDGNVKKLIFTFLLLWAVITLGIVGNVMRSLAPLFLTHLVALVVAYGGIIYYVLKGRLIWIALASPLMTLITYLILAWLGNEHLPSVFG